MKEGMKEGLKEGRQEGRAEGKAENSREVAKAFLAKGVDVSIIASCTGLSEKEIKELK